MFLSLIYLLDAKPPRQRGVPISSSELGFNVGPQQINTNTINPQVLEDAARRAREIERNQNRTGVEPPIHTHGPRYATAQSDDRNTGRLLNYDLQHGNK